MWCMNSLAVLAAASLAGADLALAALALAELEPPSGRGARMTLDLPGGDGAADRRELQCQPGLDAGRARAARPGAVGPRGRRIAVLGDMLELGAARRRAASRPRRSDRATMRSISCSAPARCIARCGRLFPPSAGAAMPMTSAALEADVLGALRAGDAIMVKGSLGSKMGPIVKALDHAVLPASARAGRPPKADPMLYWLADLSEHALDLQRLPLPDGADRRAR